MKTSVALIGFMGSGKTAVGRALARELKRKFIELDSLVEQLAGKSIPDIFWQDGEIAFRELEIEAVKQIAGEKRAVIACGGGIVLNQINIDRLKKEAVIVYLTAAPQAILKRVMADKVVRPLLQVEDQTATVRELLRFRRPYYQRAADLTINTSKLDVGAVVEQIIAKLKEDESFN